MRLLVTGASGFIGRHLVERLVRDGHRVRALVLTSKPALDWPVGVEVMAGDVRDSQTMKTAAVGCETVFHLAGKAHALSEVRGDEDAYRAINTDGTRHVLEGAVAGGAKAFVLFSSVKAMGGGGAAGVWTSPLMARRKRPTVGPSGRRSAWRLRSAGGPASM